MRIVFRKNSLRTKRMANQTVHVSLLAQCLKPSIVHDFKCKTDHSRKSVQICFPIIRPEATVLTKPGHCNIGNDAIEKLFACYSKYRLTATLGKDTNDIHLVSVANNLAKCPYPIIQIRWQPEDAMQTHCHSDNRSLIAIIYKLKKVSGIAQINARKPPSL